VGHALFVRRLQQARPEGAVDLNTRPDDLLRPPPKPPRLPASLLAAHAAVRSRGGSIARKSST
jgi:hypothetical protein